MIILHRLARWSKETRRSGFFEMKSLSNRRCKENPGLIDSPSDHSPPPAPKVAVSGTHCGDSQLHPTRDEIASDRAQSARIVAVVAIVAENKEAVMRNVHWLERAQRRPTWGIRDTMLVAVGFLGGNDDTNAMGRRNPIKVQDG